MDEPFWVYSVVALMLALSRGLIQEIPALLKTGLWGIAVLLVGSIVLPSTLVASDAGPWTVGGIVGSFVGGYLLARFSRTCPRCGMPLRVLKRAIAHHGRRGEVVDGRTCRSCGYVVYGEGIQLREELDRDRKSYAMGDTWREKAPALIKRIEATGGHVLVDEFVEWCRAGGLRDVPDDNSKQTIVVNEFLRQKGL